MRRGHPGIGGWRGENIRHYRPRTGGIPHFRSSRSYGLLDTPRFPPPNSRFKEPPFNTRPDYISSEHRERNKYRLVNQHNIQRHDRDHHGPRGNYPHGPRRHGDGSTYPQYQDSRSYHENVQPEQYLINSMGDVDHRQLMTTPKAHELYSQQRTSIWNQNETRSYYDDRNQNKSYRPDLAENTKLPTSDYIGHRPPASDHYGGNPGSAIDNSNSFSRSVDDTVDLVRKRLLNRNEPQHHSENQSDDQNQDNQEARLHNADNSCPGAQEVPTKKRVQRQRQNVKNNCDKIKNKIVHQLFKMDKDKIHKLMDNPSSSTKFEYAISSLITESQNSLNRHMRSVAEKSLTTSSDFINNDNNTIYEDTFMKQMQCILDPQDTMFLEDIKPLVMEELSKVLQLDNYYEQSQENTESHTNYHPTDDIQYGNTDNYDIYNDMYPYEESDQHNYELQNPEMNIKKYYEFTAQPEEPLFERRAKVQRSKSQERRFSMEQRRLSRISADTRSTENLYSLPDPLTMEQHRTSIDRQSYEEPTLSDTLPIFDSNAEQFSEDEDPFADLDKQYHVAVDHNFIQSYDASPQPSIASSRSKSPPTIKKEAATDLATPIKNSNVIKQEIDSQLFNIAKSPIELIPNVTETPRKQTPYKNVQVKHDASITPVKKPGADEDKALKCYVHPENNTEGKDLDQKLGTSDNSNSTMKHSSSRSSRKRSLDQRPSHRKEKRKKSEPTQTEPSKQILNKNIIINVNDCATKKNEKCAEAAKSIFNLYFSKNDHNKEPPKDTNKIESADKNYSDKYVKRKEHSNSSKETKPTETKKRHNSTSTSHSIVSPKANNNVSASSSQPPKSDKTDTANKLQHIDMFTEHPRKTSLHQSNRNTALPPKTPVKTREENKSKLPTIKVKHTGLVAKKLLTKETQTFESKKSTSRFCQTEKKKFATKAIQTDLVTPEKTGPKSTDTFERMKEIDLEIQVLLQEKFKLYSSLESKDSTQSQTLGMTVLNVGPFDEDKGNYSETEDAIVADFTSIPVEELEQIALETAEDVAFEPPKGRKNPRQKFVARERTTSRSPSLTKNKKGKAPNISLIEQIIIDDRPIEDIISLDDLECSPIKPKKKPTKQVAKTKKKTTQKKSKPNKLQNLNKKIITTSVQLKECFVLLDREAIENYLKIKNTQSDLSFAKKLDEPSVIVETVPLFADSEIESMYNVQENMETVQETVVNDDSVNANDIHFDMLDVSEDIVIGDVGDVKSNKDAGGRLDISVCEEVILDNSQSSLEDLMPVEAVPPDSQCKMYDFSTDESLRRDAYTITSNPDAVLALECIENNNFLAACLDGNVYHYNSDGQLITTLRGYNQPVTCLNIVKEKYGTTVYTGSLDSRIRYYDLESGMEKGPECNVLSPIQSMDRAWDTVFVGTRTGFVLQFECKNNMLIPVSTVKFSEQSILALRAMKEGPRKVLLVAARSEDVTIKDAQTGLLLRTFSGPKMTVYSLLYEDGKVFCGTSSHQIHIFDYASSSHLATHEGGKGVVCLRASGGLLFAGCYDGCVYVYREGGPRPLAQLRGPGLMLLSLAIVGTKIIAGYKDRGLHIWKIPLTILQEMIL